MSDVTRASPTEASASLHRAVAVAVGAPLAQLGRAQRQRQALEAQAVSLGQLQGRAHVVGRQFTLADDIARLAPEHRDAGGQEPAQLAFDQWIAVFEHEDARRVRGQLTQFLDRQGIRANVEVVRRRRHVGEVLEVVVARDTRRHDPQGLPVAGQGELVDGMVLTVGAQVALPIEQCRPLPARVARQEDPRGVARRMRRRVLIARVARLDDRPRVREPRHQADHHRDAEALGVVEGLARHVVRFLLRRRLEAGDAREVGVEPAVLLVLRAVHARVVGHGHHEAAVDRDQRAVHEGIGRHVEADVLHRDERAAADERDAEGRLIGRLLVGAPVGRRPAVVRGVTDEVFDDLGGRRAGVCVGRAQARVHGPERNCFIAEEDEVRHAPR